ncbi:MAG: 16S rRNA (guanine(966)-N(2))-methyltransferase RsmD [Gemmatimonadota bacterium]|nr:16S rRNA (guanine(966)-N(2))-methyltransferase RsmD [Gemmatimonadota bacterium]MDH5759354.1 16S rRNA (guanine(966)-N(2))-methyltransferase RsmD [Gemmatimonadota bacterium]
MRIIAGRWRGRRLNPLKGRNIRPTTDRVREAWMSALGGDLADRAVLDLFAGSGALGLEALSRGAVGVVFVESARSSQKVLEANIHLLGAEESCTVIHDDVFRYLRRLGQEADAGLPFHVALADPPYGTGDAQRLADAFRERPFASQLWLEHPSREDVGTQCVARSRRYGDTTLTTLVAEP